MQTEYLVRVDGFEFWDKHCPTACFQYGNLSVVVSDDIWDGDTVDILLFIDGQLIDHVAIYSLFYSNQNVGNIPLLSGDTIGLSFAEKNGAFKFPQSHDSS